MLVKRNEYLTIYTQNNHESIRLGQFLEERCLHENPLYEKKNRHLKNVLFSKEPKYIRTYKKEKHGNINVFKVLKANKFIYDELFKLGFPIEFQDERTTCSANINALVGPRDDEQKKAINSIVNNDFGYGLLSASPAMGKIDAC